MTDQASIIEQYGVSDLTEDPRWLSWSTSALESIGDRSRIVVNPVI
jgi:hypothetical protein